MGKFGAAFLQKPADDGLNLAEVQQLFQMLNDDRAIPSEIPNTNGTAFALGFISNKTFEDTDIEEMIVGIQAILDDMELENESGQYRIENTDVYIGY